MSVSFDEIPIEIVCNEIVPNITNLLDRCNFQRTCKLYSHLTTPCRIPGWLLDDLPSEVMKHEELWASLGRQYRFFPSCGSPLHISLARDKVRIKWYGSNYPKDWIGITYEYILKQKTAGDIHKCSDMTKPEQPGCFCSKIGRRETKMESFKSIQTKSGWIRTSACNFCFYRSI